MRPLLLILALTVVQQLLGVGWTLALVALGVAVLVLMFAMNIINWRRERERREANPLWYKKHDPVLEPLALPDSVDRVDLPPLPTAFPAAKSSTDEDNDISLTFDDPNAVPSQPTAGVPVAGQNSASRWSRISQVETASASTGDAVTPASRLAGAPRNDAGAKMSRWSGITPVQTAPKDRARVLCRHCGSNVAVTVQGICPICWRTLSLPPRGE